jgi:hypothetical protein
VKEEPLEALGSMADMAQVKRNPLLRARSCLQHVLHDNTCEWSVMISSRLSLCYVELAFANFRKVREMAVTILHELNDIVVNEDTQSKNTQSKNKVRLYKRQIATVTMYLSEANCALGDVDTAMKQILGDGTDNALNQLASHLSGVTMEQASKNAAAQRRLTKAQVMARSSAAVISATFSKSGLAMELAQSAKTMEDMCSIGADSSVARRAVVYATLRENNAATTLSALLS